jgi:YD repeat-containing protein
MRGIYAQANRGVVERWISPKGDGSDEAQHHWIYSASYGPNFSPPYKVTITAPDSTHTDGSNTSLVTTTVYDFNTGLILSTTDPNGQTMTFTYNDFLNRPKTVITPDGG